MTIRYRSLGLQSDVGRHKPGVLHTLLLNPFCHHSDHGDPSGEGECRIPDSYGRYSALMQALYRQLMNMANFHRATDV